MLPKAFPSNDDTPSPGLPPVQRPSESNAAVIARLVGIGVGVATVVITAVNLPLQRAIAGACILAAALALLSLLLPSQQWYRLHRGMIVVLALALIASGVSVWADAQGEQPDPRDSWSPTSTSTPTLPSPTPSPLESAPPTTVTPPSESSGPNKTPPPQPAGDENAQRFVNAFRGPGDQSVSASLSTDVKYQGKNSVEIKFSKDSNYYEAFFDLKQLFPEVSNWKGRTWSCHLRLGSLKATTATWGGYVFKDKDYKYDYGADDVFAHLPGEWVELRAVVGKTGEPNRWGGVAQQDPSFDAAKLNGFALFFAPSKDGLYIGKSVHISSCTHS